MWLDGNNNFKERNKFQGTKQADIVKYHLHVSK
jgi:hypothetical protein